MKKILMTILMITITFSLSSCKKDDEEIICEPGYSLYVQECVKDDIAYNENLYTSSEDIPLIFTTEPSRYELIEDTNTGVKVVYQYDMPVPSFDTWDNLEANRQKVDLNGLWNFTFDNNLTGIDNEFYLPGADLENDFEVSVPSNWDFYNEDTKDWYNYQNNDFNKFDEFSNKQYGWYTRTFDLEEDFFGERFVKLNSLGMTYRSWIFVNGQFVEAHDGSYEYFSIDVTDYLKEGENTIAILLYRKPVFLEDTVNGDPEGILNTDSQFMPHSGIEPWNYGGMHGDIWLESTEEITISKILLNAHDNELETYTVLYNNSDETKHVSLEIYKNIDDTSSIRVVNNITILPHSTRVIVEILPILEALPWSYETPNMYEMKVLMYEENNLIDSLHSTYGMRTIETYSNEPGIADGAGILLNSQEIKLKGFGWNDDFYSESLHSSGNVISEEMYRFQFNHIRNEMDANFLRNLQNTRHPRAYDLMDEYGIMNMQETPFHWLNPNVVTYQLNTYGAAEMMMAVTVWNNMNHPSIIMYSLQNEPTSPENAAMAMFTEVMNDLTKSIDVQDRLTTVCLRAEGQWWTDIPKYIDIFSYNQKSGGIPVSYDIYGTEMNPNLNASDFMQPLRYMLNNIIEAYPDLPILYSEPGAWQYLRTDTQFYQMNEYNMMKEQWSIITTEPEYHSIGFSLYTYNEYKTTFLGSDGDGIAGFGVVPINYSPEYLEIMEDFAGILPPEETLGRFFYTLEYGEFEYIPDE